MVWQQQSQDRHQYTMDDAPRTAWQSTYVYEPKMVKSGGSSFKGAVDIASLIFSTFVAFIAYHEMGKISFVENLPLAARYLVLGCTSIVFFIATARLTYTRSFRVLAGFGIFAFGIILFF